MELYDLHVTRERIDEDAQNLGVGLTIFADAQEEILRWLREWDLTPTRFSIRLPHLDSDLRIVITFGNDALVPFASLEGAFWSFVQNLMPLDMDLSGTTDDLIPFRSAEFRESDWDVVVIPDLLSPTCRFPPIEFWEKEAVNERLGMSSWRASSAGIASAKC